MTYDTLVEQIKGAAPLDFGSIFSRSIDLFKKVWLQGFITLLLTILLLLPFYIILYIPFLAVASNHPELMNAENMPPEVMLPMLILFPVFMVLAMVFTLLLNAAFLRICRQKDLNRSESDRYFHYYKKPYLGKAFILALIILGLSLAGMAACGIGLFYLIVPISLFPAFFAFDEELSAMEIVKAGFLLGNKNWLTIFGLLIVSGLLAQLGMVLCIIGVFFTAMFSKVPAYFVYKDGISATVA